MGPVAVFPDPPSPELARTLDLIGCRWAGVGTGDAALLSAPDGGWTGAVLAADADADAAWAAARALRRRADGSVPILVLVGGGQLAELDRHHELFDDFCLVPFHPAELEARLRHLLARPQGDVPAELVEQGGLLLNLETYQASIDGQPLDLTYMEYELLKFLAQNPGKVFTREVLLSRVWGYEYFGGARTVDVHVRRLRAKLGEAHANLIQTVRSVGYRFGQSPRWGQ